MGVYKEITHYGVLKCNNDSKMLRTLYKDSLFFCHIDLKRNQTAHQRVYAVRFTETHIMLIKFSKQITLLLFFHFFRVLTNKLHIIFKSSYKSLNDLHV